MFLYVVSLLNDLLYDYCDIIYLKVHAVMLCELVLSYHSVLVHWYILRGSQLERVYVRSVIGEQGPWSLPSYKTALTHAGVPSASLRGPSAESFHAHAAAALQQKCFSLCHMTCSNQIQQRGCVGWNGPRRVFFCSLHPTVNLHVSLLMASDAMNETF